MNRFWVRAMLAGFFTFSTVGVSNAQQTPPAEEKKADETKAEEAEDAAVEEAKKKAEEEAKKAEEAKAAEAAKAAEDAMKAAEAAKAAEASKAAEDAVKAAEAAKAAEDAKLEAPKAPADEPKKEEAPPAAPAAASASTDAKPAEQAAKAWRVSADLSGSLGAGFLTANPDTRSPSFGWGIDVIGTYSIIKVLDGSLDVFLRLGADHVVADTLYESAVGQTRQQEFFFRDIRLGLKTPGLYKETFTGITASATLEAFLPTSKVTIGLGRRFRFGPALSLARTFENLGPGNLSLSLGSAFRKDFSSRSNTDDSPVNQGVCRISNRVGDECLTSQRNSNYGFINSFALSYAWGPVTIGTSIAIYSTKYFAQAPEDLPEGQSRSNNVSFNEFANLSLADVSVGYTITENWNVSLAVTTFQNPYVGPDSKLRFPWFDAFETAQNLTTFDLTVGFVY